MFEIGQVVVCVDTEGFEKCQDLNDVPREGGVYTVCAVRHWNGEVALLLAEIVNPDYEWPHGYVGELAFLSWRFRPAKTTSLDVLWEVLAPAPVREPETVA